MLFPNKPLTTFYLASESWLLSVSSFSAPSSGSLGLQVFSASARICNRSLWRLFSTAGKCGYVINHFCFRSFPNRSGKPSQLIERRLSGTSKTIKDFESPLRHLVCRISVRVIRNSSASLSGQPIGWAKGWLAKLVYRERIKIYRASGSLCWLKCCASNSPLRLDEIRILKG